MCTLQMFLNHWSDRNAAWMIYGNENRTNLIFTRIGQLELEKRCLRFFLKYISCGLNQLSRSQLMAFIDELTATAMFYNFILISNNK